MVLRVYNIGRRSRKNPLVQYCSMKTVAIQVNAIVKDINHLLS